MPPRISTRRRISTVCCGSEVRLAGAVNARYDVKFGDKIGRVCVVRNVEVKDGAVFAIEEKQLTDCHR